MMEESCVLFWVYLDSFSKYLKKIENQSKWTKNSDYFASEWYSTLSHHRLFNVVVTVGVNLRLCLLSLWNKREFSSGRFCQFFVVFLEILNFTEENILQLQIECLFGVTNSPKKKNLKTQTEAEIFLWQFFVKKVSDH